MILQTAAASRPPGPLPRTPRPPRPPRPTLPPVVATANSGNIEPNTHVLDLNEAVRASLRAGSVQEGFIYAVTSRAERVEQGQSQGVRAKGDGNARHEHDNSCRLRTLTLISLIRYFAQSGEMQSVAHSSPSLTESMCTTLFAKSSTRRRTLFCLVCRSLGCAQIRKDHKDIAIVSLSSQFL